MLQISDQITYGNVTAVEIREEQDMHVVSFTADAHGGLERLWFCFRVLNDGSTEPTVGTKLVLKHYESILGGNATQESAEKICPVISRAGDDWERLPPGKPIFHDDGKMDVFWVIETPEPFVDVAMCFPYGQPEIERLVDDCPGYWKWDEIGVSQEGNSLCRLSNDYGSLESDTPGVFVFARQHASEVSGSWVLDGFLRTFAEAKPDLMVWCIPLANIDGVLNGDYGKNPFPHDLNRAWNSSRQMRHETKVFMQDINRWQHRCKPALILDFHSPGVAESGIYAFTKEENEGNTRIKRIFDSFANALGEKANDPFVKIPRYKVNSVWGEYKSLSEYVEGDLDIRCVTFETSYMSDPQGSIFSKADYQDAGKRLAEGLLDVIRTIYVA